MGLIQISQFHLKVCSWMLLVSCFLGRMLDIKTREIVLTASITNFQTRSYFEDRGVRKEKTLFLTFEASDESVLPKEQKKVDVGKRVKLLSIWEHVGGVKRGC
ncbi:hypothetical protein Peur_055893 [Populus x canadensis]